MLNISSHDACVRFANVITNPVTNSDTTNNSNQSLNASAPNFTPSIPNVWSTKFEKPIDCAFIAYRYSLGTFVELLNSER